MPRLLSSTFPWLVATILGALALLFPQPASQLAPWFFLSSALLFGVPHGACDPWVPGWVHHRPSSWLFLILFSSAYLALSALYFLLWKNFPLPATVFFLFLTAWHWGTGDASLEFPLGPRWLGFALSRGFLVMLAPFAFHPVAAWSVVTLLAPQAGPVPPPSLFWSILAVALLLDLLSRPPARARWESLLLIALFFCTPPLLSIGIYFVFFHSWRHLLRLVQIKNQIPNAALPSLYLSALRHLLLLSIPLTLATFFLFPLIPHYLPQPTPTAAAWVGPYLILLAVLTLPHAILVGWVDRNSRIASRCL